MKKNNFQSACGNRISIILCLVFGLFSACDIINPEEEIPSYIYLEDFTLETNPLTEGTNSTKITELWLTVDNVFLGGYPLPAEVPILVSGNSSLFIQPGIKDNGIAATPTVYPFYQPFEIELDLQPNITDTIKPVIQYTEDAVFSFIETFESDNQIFQDDLDGNEGTFMDRTSEGAFEGEFSGIIRLDTLNPLVIVGTLPSFSDLTERGFFVYLEMNYKSDVPVEVGIIAFTDAALDQGTDFFGFGFNERSSWNKIYFNISELFLDSSFTKYKVAFRTLLPVGSDGNFSRANANIWLDNIKLVHF